MDPFTIGASVVGLGLQAFGAFGASDDAAKAAEINKQIAGDEQKINEQKKTQMEMEARRNQLQQYRNIQRLRSQATAAAVNQGASYGSGLQGGLAEVTNQGTFNLAGIAGGLEIGRNIFNINDDISSKKMQLADVQASQAENQAWSSLGGALVSNAGTIGNLGQTGFGALNNAASLFKSNSLSGGY